MSILKLLGFGTNQKRVNKMELKRQLMEVGLIVRSITDLRLYEYDMENYFKDDDWGPPPVKEKIYKIIKEFGPNVPTTTEYDAFNNFLATSDLLPTAKQVRKNPEYQKCWDIAYKWAKSYEYKNSNEAIIDAIKSTNENYINEANTAKKTIDANNKKIEELELKIKNLESKLTEYENE